MGWFEFGAEIIAIEDSDSVGWVESATTIGDVTFRSLETFVVAVEEQLGDRKLALLPIQVHGNPLEWASAATGFPLPASTITAPSWDGSLENSFPTLG